MNYFGGEDGGFGEASPLHPPVDETLVSRGLLFVTTFSFPLVVFWLSFLLYLCCILSSTFLSSVLQFLKLCLLLKFLVVSEFFFGFFFVHAKAALAYSINE